MRSTDPPAQVRLTLVCVLLAFPLQGFATQELPEEPEPESLRPGLITEFQSEGLEGPPVLRRSASIIERWGPAAPDLRLSEDVFRSAWSGWLLIREPGDYRFRIECDGPARLQIAAAIIRTNGGSPTTSGPIFLRAGLVRLALASRHRGDDRRLLVDWAGPTFGFEHLPSHQLYHDEAQSPGPDPFELGRQLADRIGCANCHSMPGLDRHPNLGPPLDGGHLIRREWMIDWLVAPWSARPGASMPGYGLDLQGAADIAAFLDSAAARRQGPDQEARMALNVADRGLGRLLYRSSGCLGCHTLDEDLDDSSVRFEPNLASVGTKRSAEAIALYLAGPSRSTPGRHRPDLGLTAEAAAHLAAYLSSNLGDIAPPGRGSPREGDPDRGRERVEALGCASCHVIPGVQSFVSRSRLDRRSDPHAGCLAVEPTAGIPRFGLDEGQRDALRKFLTALPDGDPTLAPATIAQDALRRRHCTGCHARDGQGGDGIGPQLAQYLIEDRELNTLKGTMTPPDLSSVGAKLLPEYLDLAIHGRAPIARPWLSVRMPRYAFEPGEAESIASYFIGADRIGQGDEPVAVEAADPELGARLLGRNGFGCTSCHVLDGKLPPGGEAETLGPDLALAHQRMTRSYYRRWLSDPQRIILGTAMPQFLMPVPGVGGEVGDQLEAIWDALGEPDLAKLAAGGASQLLQPTGERALIVRDMVVVPGGSSTTYYPRGIAIGLSNDWSLLFDADEPAWVAWWDRGFLMRTKEGRLWEWHPRGRMIWNVRDRLPPVLFESDREIELPDRRRERFGTFVELAFEGAGVRLCYELNTPGGAVVRVTERIQPVEDGWSRFVELEDVPPGITPLVVAASGIPWGERGEAVIQNGPTIVRMLSDGTGSPENAAPGSVGSGSSFIRLMRGDDAKWRGGGRIEVRSP